MNSETVSKSSQADIKKTASEYELKLKELKDLIQKTLCANFGEEELTTAVKAVEEEAETVASLKSSGNKEAFDFMFDYLKGLTKRAKELHTQWKCWAPPAEQKYFQLRVCGLEQIIPKLMSRRAEFIQIRAEEDTERAEKAASDSQHQPLG